MNHTASDYLVRLTAALRDVPHGVADEIRAGIAEELAGLDPDAAAARIAQLGDPADIAREAIAADGREDAVAASAADRPPVTRTRGFAIAAALTLSFGGFVVPFVGWVVGVVLVTLSRTWRRWEKAVAIVVPAVIVLLVAAVSGGVYAVTGDVQMMGSGDPDALPMVNPLLPNLYDLSWQSAVLLLLAAIPASGLWLLWRMRGRAAR